MYESPAQTTPTWDAKASYRSRTTHRLQSYPQAMLARLDAELRAVIEALNLVCNAEAHSHVRKLH